MSVFNQFMAPEKEEITEISNVKVQAFSTGTAGTENFGGYLNEEPLQELRGRKGADQFNTMRRSDGNIAMILRAIKLPIRSANWTIQPDDESPEAIKQADLMRHILFKDMGKPWTRFTGEALSFVDFGYSLFEKTFKPVLRHEVFGPYIGIKSLGFRSQRTIERWLIDSNGNLLQIEQQSDGDTGRIVQMDNCYMIRFCPEQEGDNFEGISFLRACYGSWFRKNLYLKLLAAGIEKYAVPIPVMTIPSGKENSPEYEQAIKVLKKYTSNQTNYITIPEGWNLDIKTTTLDPEKIRESIKDENQEMVNSVLASFLLLGQKGTGSYSLGSTLGDFFATAVQFLGDHICEVINENVIADLVKLNFGTEVKCKLKVEGIKDSASSTFAEIIDKLIQSGAIHADDELEKFTREKFKLPVAKPEIKIESESKDVNAEVQTGDQVDIQKTALNGQQVTSLLEIVKDVGQGLIPRDSGIMMIQMAFNIPIAVASAIMGDTGKSFESKPQTTQLAETKRPRQDQLIRNGANELRSFMQNGLNFIGINYIEKMRRAYQSNTGFTKKSKNLKIPNDTSMPSFADYQDIILSMSLIQSAKAIEPIKSDFKLASTEEKMREIDLMIEDLNKQVSAYESSPSAQGAMSVTNLQRSIRAKLASIRSSLELSKSTIQATNSRVSTMVNTQINDLKKKVDLQYQSSVGSTDSERTLFNDLTNSKSAFLESPVIYTGPDILSSQNVNESILTESEGEPEVESYTFVAVDDDATSEICSELSGRTFSKDDPDLFRYSPPLHHNCRSYLAVNLKSFKNNPEITSEPLALSKEAMDGITLSEQLQNQFFGGNKLTQGKVSDEN